MSTFVYREPGKIVADIIQSEMELTDGQVMFTNQKIFIPTDGIFVNVSYVGPAKVIASQNEAIDDGADGLLEVQSITMLHMIQIDILGFGNEIRTRKEEIVMALRSLFSQTQQDTYQMQIARQPGMFMDTSFLEETKMITRYTTTIITTSANQKTKQVSDIYTSFRTQLNTDPVTANQPIQADPVLAHP